MMKNNSGASSQPRLLMRTSKVQSTYNSRKDSNPYQLDTFSSQVRYIPALSGSRLQDKENNLASSNSRLGSSYILSPLQDTSNISKLKSSLNSPKPSSYLTKPSASFFAKNNQQQQPDRDENDYNGANSTSNLTTKGGIRGGAVEYRKKNIRQHELIKHNEYSQVQEKVKEIENKIQRIKEVIDKKDQQRSELLKSVPSLRKQEVSNNTKAQTMIMEDLVTQAPAPVQLIQCSSQTNLYSAKVLAKAASHKYYVSTVVSAYFDKTNTSFTQLCKNHLFTSLQLLKNTRHIEKPKEVIARPLPKTNKYTIVFDLDETLIHCNQNIEVPHDVILNIRFPNGEGTKAGINVRPWAHECLKELAEHFELIVFTASHECYGNVVVDYLDPKKQYISHRYFRDSCYKTAQGYYVKDLRVIDRPLDKMLLIDNAAYSYAFQVQNGVPVIPFYDCKTDMQLKSLVHYLKSMSGSAHLVQQHCKNLRTNEYTKFTNPVELINRLYSDHLSK